MAEVVTSGGSTARKPQDDGMPGRRQRKRVGVRIDMTPMVDVAFLLLIFFMLTAVFRRPLAMEVNLPEPGARVQVPESNVVTVLVDQNEDLQMRAGKAAPVPVGWGELPETFTAQAAANPDVIILVKIHRDARYEAMVDMMDALEEAQMQRFSLVALTMEESAAASAGLDGGGGAP